MTSISTRPLNPEEQEGIAHATLWINDVLQRGFGLQVHLSGTRDDIPTLHSLLSKGPFGDDASAELMLFGTAFGEVLATELQMKWVVYEDEQGVDFALQYNDLALFVFPRDMLLKRVERGESIDSINLEQMLADISTRLEVESENVGTMSGRADS